VKSGFDRGLGFIGTDLAAKAAGVNQTVSGMKIVAPSGRPFGGCYRTERDDGENESGAGFENHAKCHPERSERFATRSGHGVEGALHRQDSFSLFRFFPAV
jgi:hypothetical protein